MGGNTLKNNIKNNKICRLNKEEYTEVSKQVITLLKKEYPNIKCGIPRSILSKKDFGDLDLVVSYTNNLNYPYLHQSKID